MKKILFTLIALLLCSLSLSAQMRIEQRYIIDGTTIEDFDGSQLEGKTIKTYKMDLSEDGGVLYKNHYITTTRQAADTPTAVLTKRPSTKTQYDQVYVVDGAVVTKHDFINTNYYDIERVDVIMGYKTENEYIKKYSTDGRDVVMITLKKEKSKRYKAFGEVGKFSNKKK